MTVGKKKKKIVVYRGRSNKSNMLPLVIAGGVILWTMFGNKPAAAVVPITDTPYDPGTDPTNLYDPHTGQLLQPGNTVVKTYTPGAPATSIITTTDPVKKQYLDSIKSRIPATAPIWPRLNAMSQQALANIWSITSYINYSDKPDYYDAFSRMTDQELKDCWYYVGNYLSTGLPLLSYTKKLPNGDWDNSNPGNAALYTAIQNIHLKYGIF